MQLVTNTGLSMLYQSVVMVIVLQSTVLIDFANNDASMLQFFISNTVVSS